MRILGIVASNGRAEHYKEAAERLKEALVETRKYTRKNAEPQISWGAKELNTHTDLAELAEDAWEADGILFAIYADGKHRVEDLLNLLIMITPFKDKTFRGKWIGFILVGAKTPLGLEAANGRLLAKANKAGLVPVPQSFATIRGKRPKEHLRLARDMAKAICSQEEWNGISIWQEAA